MVGIQVVVGQMRKGSESDSREFGIYLKQNKVVDGFQAGAVT